MPSVRERFFTFPTTASQAWVIKGGSMVSGVTFALLSETLVVLNFAS